MQHFKTTRLITLATATLCLVFAGNTQAKTIIPATLSDNTLTALTNNYVIVNTLNADMMRSSAGNELWAIALQGTNPAGATMASVYVEYDGLSASQNISLPPTATEPDIVISDDMSGTLGQDYLVTVIYVDGSAVKSATYQVKGSPFPSISATPVIGSPVILASGGSTFSHPHIDLFADRSTTSYTGVHAMHEYAATWQESAAGSFNIKLTTGNITNSGGTSTSIAPYTILVQYSNSQNPDVAAQTMATTSGTMYHDKTAWITYTNPGKSAVGVTEVQIDNFNGTTDAPTAKLTTSGTFNYNPRIEAQTLLNSTSSLAQYLVVATDAATSTEIIRLASNLPPSGSGIPGFNPSTQMANPMVAGVGANMSSGGTGVGATEYVVMYMTNDIYGPGVPAPGVYYDNAIDMTTAGLAGTPYANYRQVNKSSLNTTAATSAGNNACAVTNCSNTGDDVLSVWFDGATSPGITGVGKIKYKFGTNSYAFKSTGIANAQQSRFKVYPNPATDVLIIEGTGNLTYAVTDILGKVISNGTINDKGTVNASQLANGTYMLQLSNGTDQQTIKFIKE